MANWIPEVMLEADKVGLVVDCYSTHFVAFNHPNLLLEKKISIKSPEEWEEFKLKATKLYLQILAQSQMIKVD